MSRRPTIARRVALIAGTAAAVTAILSATVTFALLGLRLTAADIRTATGLAAAIESGIARERAEEPTLERAARDVLDESALDGVRMEVWGASGLIAAGGAGSQLGPGSGPTGDGPIRKKGRLIVRRRGSEGLTIAVAVPVSFSRTLQREMGYALVLCVLPLSVLSALISVRLARRALAPLETLAQEVAARHPSDPWQPLVAISGDAEIIRLADALNETGQRLTQALAAEREFAAFAAHALRTPLTRLVAESHSGTRPTGGALETLRRLVDSLLLLVRSSPRLHETGMTANAADLLRQVAASRAGRSRLFEVEASDEVLVRGDEELLLAAVEHLVDNAVAYSPPGTTVHLAAGERDGTVTISVRDEGPGVASDDLERIFEPFVRGTTSGRTSGSGLGLALVRRIAAGHGGSVRAVPSGAGTSFEVNLPAWRAR